MISYDYTYGYKSRVYPARMFADRDDALQFDSSAAIELLCGITEARAAIILTAPSDNGGSIDATRRAIAHFAEMLKERENEEAIKRYEARCAAKKEQGDNISSEAEAGIAGVLEAAE